MTSIGEIFDSIINQLPLPKTVFEGTWFFIGWMAGNAFGAKCDEDTMEWIEKEITGKHKQGIMKFFAKALNFLHHSWIGLLGVVYFGIAPVALSIDLPLFLSVFPTAEAFWFFLGLATEDIQYHLRASMRDGQLNRLLPK